MFKANLIALCVLLLSACSAQRLVLSLESTTLINPDAKHQALTLYIKIFQLSDKKSFEQLSEKQLWQARTNKTILSIKTVLVSNSNTQLISVNLKPKARYVGFAANFRQGAKQNKLVYSVKNGIFSGNHLVLQVKHNQISLEDVA